MQEAKAERAEHLQSVAFILRRSWYALIVKSDMSQSIQCSTASRRVTVILSHDGVEVVNGKYQIATSHR